MSYSFKERIIFPRNNILQAALLFPTGRAVSRQRQDDRAVNERWHLPAKLLRITQPAQHPYSNYK